MSFIWDDKFVASILIRRPMNKRTKNMAGIGAVLAGAFALCGFFHTELSYFLNQVLCAAMYLLECSETLIFSLVYYGIPILVFGWMLFFIFKVKKHG